ncbi:hypothetical protein [Leifsonella bigeumensis]|uniref:hypothetical protein n=1 Tax=Leifsonella bigeumensis TaxID=433643 RepID=UPI0031E131CA
MLMPSEKPAQNWKNTIAAARPRAIVTTVRRETPRLRPAIVMATAKVAAAANQNTTHSTMWEIPRMRSGALSPA